MEDEKHNGAIGPDDADKLAQALHERGVISAESRLAVAQTLREYVRTYEATCAQLRIERDNAVRALMHGAPPTTGAASAEAPAESPAEKKKWW